MTEFQQKFQQKFLQPLPNELVEQFAHVLAQQAGYTRSWVLEEFEKLPEEPRHSFREIATEYADLLGVDAFKPNEP